MHQLLGVALCGRSRNRRSISAFDGGRQRGNQPVCKVAGQMDVLRHSRLKKGFARLPRDLVKMTAQFRGYLRKRCRSGKAIRLFIEQGMLLLAQAVGRHRDVRPVVRAAAQKNEIGARGKNADVVRFDRLPAQPLVAGLLRHSGDKIHLIFPGSPVNDPGAAFESELQKTLSKRIPLDAPAIIRRLGQYQPYLSRAECPRPNHRRYSTGIASA